MYVLPQSRVNQLRYLGCILLAIPAGFIGGGGLEERIFKYLIHLASSILYAFYLFLNLRCAIVGEENKQYSATILVFGTSQGLF